MPMGVARRGIRREARGREQAEARERLFPAPHRGRERGGVGAAELGQEGRGAVADGEVTAIVGLRPQRGGVHDLQGHRARGHERGHGRPRVGQLGEVHEGGRPLGQLGHGA